MNVKPVPGVSLLCGRLRLHDVLQNRRDGVRLVLSEELSHAWRLVSLAHLRLRLRVGALILARQAVVIRQVGKVGQSWEVWVGDQRKRVETLYRIVVDLIWTL